MWWLVILGLLVRAEGAAASSGFDFGDTLALIIGLFLTIIGFFACMGAYARRRARFDAI